MKTTFAAPIVGVLIAGCGSVRGPIADELDGAGLDATADARGIDGPQITCAPPTAPANGSVTVANGDPNTALYSCDAGFGVSGPISRTCATDGSWTGADPVCFSGAGGGTWRFRRPIPIAGSSA